MKTKKKKIRTIDVDPSESTALAVYNPAAVDADTLAEQTSGGGGFSYIKLIQPQSTAHDSDEDLKDGEFLLGNDTKLGKSFQGLPMAHRARATLFKDRELLGESFDPKSAEYVQIKNNRKGSYGLEFLFWIEKNKAFGVFGFTKATTRSIGAKVAAALAGKLVCTVTGKMTGNKKGRFAVPVVVSGPSEKPLKGPTKQQFEAALASFLSPGQETPAPKDSKER